VLWVIGLADSLDNCTGALWLWTSVHPVLGLLVLKSLWTTAPTLVLDFVGSSGALSPVESTLFKPGHRFNR